ncbi:type I restriction enzyme S subunit [Paenibacillus sp. DS2015]|uniref:restriction endonuclease subunit S n=1 Tax=Paenibacillus sp. DS2015 TaxID=3373917 RepID=UPI003D1EDDE5
MWEIKKFNDFIKLNRGFDLPNEKMVDGKIPVVASTSIKGYHNQFKIKAPCVVTGRSGSLGAVQYIAEDCWPLNTSLYVKDFKGSFPKYVYYYLQTMHLEIYNSGAGVPTLNQNHLHNVRLKVHNVPNQQKIADILSAYDDLIKNNNHRIELLVQAAQQIYKEWFVRFHFPGFESAHFSKGIPYGWEVKKISEIVEVIDGDRGTNYPNQNEMFDEGYCLFLNAGNVTKNGFDYSRNTFITKDKDSKLRNGKLNRDDIVITTRGTVGNVALYNSFVPYNNVRINSGMVIVRPINSVTNISFLYLLLRSSSVQQLITLFSSGSAQPQLPIKDMKRIKVLIPSIELLTAFEVVVKPILDSISSNMAKNQNLIKQRDLLLPRLMSGKLEV